MSTTAVSSETISSPGEDDSTQNPHVGQHPALKEVSILDCSTCSEIWPNTGPTKLDNECFSGEVMVLIRTPDVDNQEEPMPAGATASRVSRYMKGLKRRFEFQFQIKLKRIPTGPLFLGCEVEQIIKLSRVTKALTTFLLAMIRRMNSGFHYSWGIDMENTDAATLEGGDYEKTHLSFPVEASMDRIVITKPGEEPPKLGHELFETVASHKRRRRIGAGSVDWNLEDTYTLALWSAYFDWIQWRVMNVPGCRSFSLTSVTGRQPIYLSVYEVSGVTPQEYKKKKPPHSRKDLKIFTRLEFANSTNTDGGIISRFRKGTAARKHAYSVTETESDLYSESDGDEGNAKPSET